jgi:cytochrome P450
VQEVVGALNDVLGAVSNPVVTAPLGGYILRLKHRRALAIIDRVIYDAIDKGMKVWGCARSLCECAYLPLGQDVPAAGTPPRDLLDVLLMARDEHGKGLTRTNIRNQILLFFIAGSVPCVWCVMI